MPEVPLKGKNKTLVKILGGRQHRTAPAGQILGGRDPCNPCGVDAYACLRMTVISHVLNADIGQYADTLRQLVTRSERRAVDCSGHIQSTSVRVRFWVLYKYDEFSKFGKYKPKGACTGQCDPCKLSWLSYNMLEAVQDEHVVTIVTYIRNNV